jgi:hypothetical protein
MAVWIKERERDKKEQPRGHVFVDVKESETLSGTKMILHAPERERERERKKKT